MRVLWAIAALVVLSSDCWARCLDGEVNDSNCLCTNNQWHCAKQHSSRLTRSTGFQERKYKRKRGVPIAADLKHTPCAPTDRFIIECNQCYCNAERTGYVCTDNICPATSPKPKTDVANATTDANNHQNGLDGQGRAIETHITNTDSQQNQNFNPPKANGRQQRNDEEVPEAEEKKSTTIQPSEHAQTI